MEMSLIGNDDNDPNTLKIHIKISKTLSYKENWLLFLAGTSILSETELRI